MPKAKVKLTTHLQTNLSLYKMDLLYEKDKPGEEIARPYHDQDRSITLIILLTLLKRAMKARNRIQALAYAFYVGEWIFESTEPRLEWKDFVKNNPTKNENYLYKGATRVYQVFRHNLQQIYHTQKVSLWVLEGMSVHDFENSFLPFAESVHLINNIDLEFNSSSVDLSN
jgi:hypothetical protein